MNQSSPHEDNPHCAGLPHGTVNVHLTWCSHRQAWTVSLTEGKAEEPLLVAEELLGPFDGDAEALALAVAWLASGVHRVRSACA